MQDVTIPPSSSIAFAYHGNKHHLYVGSKACDYTTEICPNKNATDVTAANPCNYAFPATGPPALNEQCIALDDVYTAGARLPLVSAFTQHNMHKTAPSWNTHMPQRIDAMQSPLTLLATAVIASRSKSCTAELTCWLCRGFLRQR